MILKIGFLLLTLGFASAGSPLARSEIGNPKSTAADYLLPNNLQPYLYSVELEPNFETSTFNGSVSIEFASIVYIHNITLHVNGLQIDESSVRLVDESGNIAREILGITTSNDNRHFYQIHFNESLASSVVYTLVIDSFTGILNSNNYGFYLAKYIDENGVERKLATTQFESTDARRAFPCFDEPALKAQFDISLIRSAEYHSISNAPLLSTTEISEGRFLDKFARTAKMSTYLVAFVVSDFDYIGEENQRVFLRPQAIAADTAGYALKTGIAILNALADTVDVPYSLDKMDQIGLPDGYFSAGAMENWGLVTYREIYLMNIDKVTASNYKESTATIIGHEYAHQWFGNLVSPFWWSYIWLNEGFATYFEFYSASVVEKDMELMDQMVVKSVQYALGRDSTANTRPMNQDAGSPNDIDSLFDTVAYDKSGAVIRMMEGILSMSVFFRGLHLYLLDMQYSAAQPGDLYANWQKAADEANIDVFADNTNVLSVMSTWDSNPGYPLLTVTRNYENGDVFFSQRRYISANPNNQDESIWYIPISYATGTNPDFADTSIDLWLTTRNATETLSELNNDDWLVVNIQQKGYYRVNYDNENWNRIASYLYSENFATVSRLNRAQFIDDSFNLARYGVIDYHIPLEISRYLIRETDYIPIYPFVSSLTFLDPFISNTGAYQYFQNCILRLFAAAYESVGLEEREDDPHLVKLNRINILTWVCKYGDMPCREFALEKLQSWEQDENEMIPPNLQTPLSCAALRIGDQNDWNFLFNKYVNEVEAVVRARLLSAFGCSENDDVLNNFMDIILDTGSSLRSADRLTAFASIYNSGPYGVNFAYNYLKENFAKVVGSVSTSQLSSMLNGIAGRFSTEEQLNDLQDFASTVGSSAAFTSALNTVRSNINWSNVYMSSILGWLGASS